LPEEKFHKTHCASYRRKKYRRTFYRHIESTNISKRTERYRTGKHRNVLELAETYQVKQKLVPKRDDADHDANGV